MRKLSSFILVFLLSTLITFGQAPEKHRVAVMDFGYGAVSNNVQAIFGTNQDIGRGVVDLLVNRMVNDGTYRLIERTALEKIVKEQNFSNSDRANPSTAAKLGALLGADIIVIGDVTQFGRDDKHYGGGGNGGGTWWSNGAGSLGINKSKAVVEITARMVDVHTGEILASVTGRGESQRSGLKSSTSAYSGWKNGGGDVDLGSTNFEESILGQAVKQSVTQLASNLEGKAPSLPTIQAPQAAALPPLDGLVADATNGEITVNVGSGAGVHAGDVLAITRVARTIKDPATGKPLKTVETAVGTVTVASVDENSATGKFSGSETPQVGDKVKRPDHP